MERSGSPIGQALVFAGVCLVVGTWVARRVGLLERNAPAGETIGVGLASGLLVLAAWWAAFASGGRSSFTPVAVAFVVAIALTMIRAAPAAADADTSAVSRARTSNHRGLIVAVVAGCVFIAGVALLYGSTLTLSPREANPAEEGVVLSVVAAHPDTANPWILAEPSARSPTRRCHPRSPLPG